MAQWIRHRPTEPGIAGSSPAGVIFHIFALFRIGIRHTHASKHLFSLLASHQKGATCHDCNLRLRNENHSAPAASDFPYCLTWALQETPTPHLCAMRFASLRYESCLQSCLPGRGQESCLQSCLPGRGQESFAFALACSASVCSFLI